MDEPHAPHEARTLRSQRLEDEIDRAWTQWRRLHEEYLRVESTSNMTMDKQLRLKTVMDLAFWRWIELEEDALEIEED